MRKKISTTITTLTAVMFIAIALQSCTDDEPYYSGTALTSNNWELVEVNGYAVSELDVCEFRFFNFGDGTYGRYDAYASWYEIPIRWEVTGTPGGADYLYVYPSGTGQTWEYLMRLYGGYPAMLELNDLATGDRLLFQAYR